MLSRNYSSADTPNSEPNKLDICSLSLADHWSSVEQLGSGRQIVCIFPCPHINRLATSITARLDEAALDSCGTGDTCIVSSLIKFLHCHMGRPTSVVLRGILKLKLLYNFDTKTKLKQNKNYFHPYT